MKIDLNKRADLAPLREGLNALLDEYGEAHGLKLECGHITYGDGRATIKVLAANVAEDGTYTVQEAADFLRYQKAGLLEGFEADDLGREFTLICDQYVLIGYLPRSKKYPILARRLSDGKRMKFTLQGVARSLENERSLDA